MKLKVASYLIATVIFICGCVSISKQQTTQDKQFERINKQIDLLIQERDLSVEGWKECSDGLNYHDTAVKLQKLVAEEMKLKEIYEK